MKPDLHRANAFLPTEDFNSLRRMCWYCASIDCLWRIFPELSNSFVAKMAIACASRDFGMFLFSSKKAEIMNRGFAVLPCSADASALSLKVLTLLKAPFIFLQKVLKSCFASFNPPLQVWGAKDVRAEEKRTCWRPIVIVGVATIDKRRIYEGIVWYTSTTSLL